MCGCDPLQRRPDNCRALFSSSPRRRYDYTFTFLATAIIQTVGALGYALLLPLVPRKEKDLAKSASKESLTEPLLGGGEEEEREEGGSLPGVV